MKSKIEVNPISGKKSLMVFYDPDVVDFNSAVDAIMSLLTDGKEESRRIKTEMGKIGRNMEELGDFQEKLTDRVYQIDDWSRKPFPAAIIKTYLAVVEKFYNGQCPYCGESQILNPIGGRNSNLELDHFKNQRWNKLTEGWSICKNCHSLLTHGYLGRDGTSAETAFKMFQTKIAQFAGTERDRQQGQLF